jgi:hypothetical protein
VTLLKKLWSYVVFFAKRAFTYVVHHPLALAATVLLIVAAAACLVGGRTFQIGGLLQKLWGAKVPDARGVPPAARTGPDGKPIEPGQSDDRGFVQAPVSTQIVAPGIFSNPDTITVVHPDKGQVTISLPTGMKNTDVKEVTEIAPSVYEVKNNDTGVRPATVGDLLNKIDQQQSKKG